MRMRGLREFMMILVGFILICGTVMTSAPASADSSVVNLFTDLTTTDEAGMELAGWQSSGAGARAWVTICTTANTKVYTRADLNLIDREAFSIEAVVSAPPLGTAGEVGARLWARFTDPDAPLFPPGPNNRYIEVRLMENSAGQRRFALFDGVSGVEMAAVDANWTAGTPRYRVRLKRQSIAGLPTVIMQVEPSDVFDDPANPNPYPDTAMSKSVLLSAFSHSSGPANQIGFGHVVPGTYTSDWESIHVTRAADPTTILPYWPPAPPLPVIVFSDQSAGNPQVVNFSVDCLGIPYLANDSVTPYLDANGTTFVKASRTPPGDEQWYFDGLNDNQTVYGRVVASEISGRITTSPDASAVVPLGQPRISGTVTAKGLQSQTATQKVIYLDVRLINTGTGHARNLKIASLPVRTLAGAGAVSYNTALSPSLPITVGDLYVGEAKITRLYFNVPKTVTRFSVTESGTLQNVLGNRFSFSTVQSVMP